MALFWGSPHVLRVFQFWMMGRKTTSIYGCIQQIVPFTFLLFFPLFKYFPLTQVQIRSRRLQGKYEGSLYIFLSLSLFLWAPSSLIVCFSNCSHSELFNICSLYIFLNHRVASFFYLDLSSLCYILGTSSSPEFSDRWYFPLPIFAVSGNILAFYN